MSLNDFGWDERYQKEWNERCADGMVPGRIVVSTTANMEENRVVPSKRLWTAES